MKQRLAAACLALPSLCAAQAAPQTAENFWARAMESLAANRGYFTGEDLYRRGKDGFTLGYLTSVYDSDSTAKVEGPSYCVPDGVKNGQLADVAWKYLEDRPAERHLSAAYLARLSFRAAWPCPR